MCQLRIVAHVTSYYNEKWSKTPRACPYHEQERRANGKYLDPYLSVACARVMAVRDVSCCCHCPLAKCCDGVQRTSALKCEAI